MQRLFFGRVAKVQVTAGNRAVRAELGGPGAALRQVQQLENVVAGGHAVHGNVEVRPQRAHRQEEIRRQQNDAERARQCYAVCIELMRGHDDAQRRAAVGDDVHDDDRVELHRQHLHRHLAEVLGLTVHGRVAGLVGLINLERGQPLQVLQKAVAQRSVPAPVLAQQLFSKFLHSHDGNRDERHTDHQDDRRVQTDWGQRNKQRDRCDHGVEKLRQIRAEVGLELLDALACQLQNLRGGHGLGVAAAQAEQLFINGGTQRFFDGAAGVVAGRRRAARAEKAHDQRTENVQKCGGQVRRAVQQPRQ